MPASPQRLIDGQIEQLRRFGFGVFGMSGGAETDSPPWSAMWELLKTDFSTVQRVHVPSYEEMTPWPQEGARIYMRRRLLADHLFEECQNLYKLLHSDGINSELVEAYTLARDAYEESVGDFGAARETLEKVFTQTVDL
jgi:hypothetical protein